MAEKRIWLGILMLIPLLSMAQRKNQELPLFESIPYFTLSDSLEGWSLSADKQWLSAEKTIPVIGISRNTEFYEQKNNYLGIDNIQSLLAYKVKYGSDTMICVVKLFRNGFFFYPNRKTGWEERTDMYYWLIEYQDLKHALDYYEENDTGQAFVLKIRSYDSKLIEDVDEDEVLELLRSHMLLKKNFDRDLALTVRRGAYSDRFQFHLASLHVVFNDVEGVRQDFRGLNGRSLIGSTYLFDHLYYEIDKEHFMRILNLDANLNQLLEDGLESPYLPSKSDSSGSDDWDLEGDDGEELDWDEEDEDFDGV